jgi:hypothetical protein
VRYLWLAALLLIATPAVASEVYRSFDADGNVVYSDRPDSPGAEPIRIIAPTPVLATAAGADARPEPPAPEDSEPLGAEIVNEPTAEEERALRAHNCEIARERQQLYSMSRRLFRTLPDGEREYLSEDEMSQARDMAARDVEAWCD